MHPRARTLLPGLFLLLALEPASAVESLTGTWEGVLRCEVLDSGATTRSKVAATLEIVDDGPGGVRVEVVSTDYLFIGFGLVQEIARSCTLKAKRVNTSEPDVTSCAT
jgi:hypothetical protein